MRRLLLAMKALFGRDGEVFSLEEVHGLYIDTRHASFEAGYTKALKDFGVEENYFYQTVSNIDGIEVQVKRKH